MYDIHGVPELLTDFKIKLHTNSEKCNAGGGGAGFHHVYYPTFKNKRVSCWKREKLTPLVINLEYIKITSKYEKNLIIYFEIIFIFMKCITISLSFCMDKIFYI